MNVRRISTFCFLGTVGFAGPMGGCDYTSGDESELHPNVGNSTNSGEGDDSGASGNPAPSGGDGGRARGDAGVAPGKDSGTPAGSGSHDAGAGPVDGGAGSPRRDASGPSADGGKPDARADASSTRDAAVGRCGTRGGVQCEGGEFCNYEPDAQCGATDRGGVCETKPDLCEDLYQPVCGCDDETYSNACAAHAAGVSVKREGECTSKPSAGGRTCGGFAGLSCDGDQFCNYEPEAGGQGCEGIADASGVCEATPQACTREYAPVCGCDHRTYATRCTAHSQGASVLHDGACSEIDCAAIGGRAVDGIGPAPACGAGETSYGEVRYSSGQIAIEGTICCVPG